MLSLFHFGSADIQEAHAVIDDPPGGAKELGGASLNPLGLPECIEHQFSLEGADGFLQ